MLSACVLIRLRSPFICPRKKYVHDTQRRTHTSKRAHAHIRTLEPPRVNHLPKIHKCYKCNGGKNEESSMADDTTSVKTAIKENALDGFTLVMRTTNYIPLFWLTYLLTYLWYHFPHLGWKILSTIWLIRRQSTFVPTSKVSGTVSQYLNGISNTNSPLRWSCNLRCRYTFFSSWPSRFVQ